MALLFRYWDIDQTILAAFIAALGIAIGFGAQGLIGDLLTGLFLIFENSLQVGDIITVGDFRGEVEEVGIRTTKLKSVVGDVKVINNSEFKSFINMTMHRSVAACELVIEYDEDIERVERVIAEHIPVLAEKYPIISEGPYYKGIFEFNEKGVKLKVVAKCHETERLQLERDLNREFKLLFDLHKIRLAVPKIELRESKAKK
jgi:small conductance mechanosensitive channel